MESNAASASRWAAPRRSARGGLSSDVSQLTRGRVGIPYPSSIPSTLYRRDHGHRAGSAPGPQQGREHRMRCWPDTSQVCICCTGSENAPSRWLRAASPKQARRAQPFSGMQRGARSRSPFTSCWHPGTQAVWSLGRHRASPGCAASYRPASRSSRSARGSPRIAERRSAAGLGAVQPELHPDDISSADRVSYLDRNRLEAIAGLGAPATDAQLDRGREMSGQRGPD